MIKTQSRKLLFSILLLSSLSTTFAADHFKNNFQGNLNQTQLDALSKDLGALIGAGSFHQGKALGFPVGFDVGVQVPVLGVNKDDLILKDDASVAYGTWGQAEIGLPLKLNLIVRGGKMQDAKLIGGGLRVGLFSSSIPGIPSVSIDGLYGKLTHDYFDAKTMTGNLVASFEIPFIHPYIGVGYDHTSLDPTAAGFLGAPASVSRSLKSTTSGYRAEAGINLSLLPFTYLTLGAGMANGQKLYHTGLGVKF